ncbi:hypothetical protein C3941_19740 [Kaistia algarum]|uniref:hypothetical protein n=1 Tax=Kaistia algarum TaxID=2083279 RepID=UPI000CE923DA|nr:hypothetical protein [Kaistia algarum]MCX5516224.1 hypothetical protein [Kaistia algarum]PPE78296.1 hypothetical protein C3941_19740 [Kaistia algarum]
MTGLRSTPAEIVDDLRELADLAADEMNEDNAALAKVMDVPTWRPEDTTEGQAADLIERYRGALQEIESGAADPRGVAVAALTEPTEASDT